MKSIERKELTINPPRANRKRARLEERREIRKALFLGRAHRLYENECREAGNSDLADEFSVPHFVVLVARFYGISKEDACGMVIHSQKFLKRFIPSGCYPGWRMIESEMDGRTYEELLWMRNLQPGEILQPTPRTGTLIGYSIGVEDFPTSFTNGRSPIVWRYTIQEVYRDGDGGIFRRGIFWLGDLTNFYLKVEQAGQFWGRVDEILGQIDEYYHADLLESLTMYVGRRECPTTSS